MISRLLAAAVLPVIAAVPVLAADLAVEIREVRSADGRLFVAVHGLETKDTFPSGADKVASLQRRAHAGTVRFVLQDLRPGRYAVSAFHDENDNGDLDTNLVGIPSEGYGFANDPNSTFGPPKFEAAAVDVGEERAVAVMTLRY